MTRWISSCILMALGAGACLSLSSEELQDDIARAGNSGPSGSGGSTSVHDGGRTSAGGTGTGGAVVGASGAPIDASSAGGNRAGGGGTGGAGGAATTGGAAGSRVDAGRAGSAGASGSGGASVAGDGGARICKGGITGMCPTPYSVSGTVDDLCKAYCDCMSGPCSSNMPANCLATCKTQIDKWDICCRINKCKARPCDYSDQFTGDCKAAAGIQACLDKG